MARSENEPVLHFSCDYCGTHLGVDGSLAGLQAPCPKCGALVSAPEAESSRSSIPSSGVTRGVSSGEVFRPIDQPVEQIRGPAVRRRRQGGNVYPTSGRMASEDERANLRILLRILVATSLVILVVVLVAWYLRTH